MHSKETWIRLENALSGRQGLESATRKDKDRT
jgi:hypothetical protein